MNQQHFFGVAAARESTAPFARIPGNGGVLPRRRYGVLQEPRPALLARSWIVVLVLLPSFALDTWADIPVVISPDAAEMEQLAARDLADALLRLHPGEAFPVTTNVPAQGQCILVGSASTDSRVGQRVKATALNGPESFIVTNANDGARQFGVIAGADARGTVYGVYALLQKLGCGFLLTGDTFPAPGTNQFSFTGWQLTDRPLVRDRLVFNWHNFLSGCSTWNLEDWQRWTTQSLKLGYNAIMVHAYGNNPMVSFEFNGKAKPVGYLSTTMKGRDWSTMHVNDVRRLWGGEVFTGPVFGAEAALVPDAQRVAAARQLMRGVFDHARQRGMKVYFAVDVDTSSANPQELIATLPETARFPIRMENLNWMGQEDRRLWLADPDTPEGYQYYRTQVETLLRDYPTLDCLVVWFRRDRTPWMGFAVEEMPPAWQQEFRAELAKTPEAGKLWYAHNIFALSKVVKAFQRALRETGHPDVELALGSWAMTFLPAADRFLPAGVKLIPLDYEVLHDHPVLEDARQREVLRQVGVHRPLIPVVWAHHDDGNYVGRPYLPSANFFTKLEESGASGYGIIHWTTRPLDLYFASLSRQVWAGTRNQGLATTCRELAERWFSPQASEGMGSYLERWITDAPKFGRETTDRFIDRPLKDVDQVVAGCGQRLRLLASVDRAKLSPAARDRLDYCKGLEEFITAVYENQPRFQEAQAKLKAGDLAAARAAIQDCDPGRVIELFARFSSLGGISRGEQGLVVTMNTRWLAHVVRLRQALGLDAVRINFAPTSHDPLAQSPGRDTFHFEPDHTLWECRGERETKAEVFGSESDSGLMLPGGLPATWKEIYATGVASESPIKFSLPELAPGTYRLRFLLRDPAATAPDQNVFDLSVSRRSSGTTWTFAPVTNEFLRVLCGGNSENNWNSLTEVRLANVARENGRPAVSASSATAGFAADKAVDGDAQTRWAADGKGQWLQFRLTPGAVTREIALDWFRDDQRRPAFELQTSPDGQTWSPVKNLQVGTRSSPVTERVDIFKLAGGRNHGIEHGQSLQLDTAGILDVSLQPVQGRANICGVVLEPVR